MGPYEYASEAKENGIGLITGTIWEVSVGLFNFCNLNNDETYCSL